MSSTVSLVDMQPSTSMRLNEVVDADGQRRLHLTGGHHRVGGDDAQHGGQLGGDHARALDHAADAVAVAFDLDGFRLGVGES